jgi:phosphonoacetaldehyde hydrolase
MPRFRRFQAAPEGIFTDLEGCLLDSGCQATTNAVKQLFAEKGVDITDEEAASGNGSLYGSDNTTKKSHLRHVLFSTCKDKWEAKHGSPPSEWDLEALFKEFARCVNSEVHRAKAIRGAVECVSMAQASGIKVAVASDFNAEAMDPWLRVAHANGFDLEHSLSCADVPNPGREGTFVCVPPDPWRCFALAARVNIFPMDTCIRVSHTTYGVEEGLNAGMWTVGISTTGSPVPSAGPAETPAMKQKRIEDGFYSKGCHYVIDGVWDLPDVIKDITQRMARGEKP